MYYKRIKSNNRFCFFLVFLGIFISGASAYSEIVAPEFPLAKSDSLRTWWHWQNQSHVDAPVLDGTVRISPFYRVNVSTEGREQKYSSYPYISIPRGGRNKWLYDHEDGADFADEANVTMSWSSFLYNEDTWVEVTLLNEGDKIYSKDDVVIRPKRLNFEKQTVDDHTIRIKVPFSNSGYRFSVEFAPQLKTIYSDNSGTSGKLTLEKNNNFAIHKMPVNSILIFAEPMPTLGSAPNRTNTTSIYYPEQGEVNLSSIETESIYFMPGVYYMPWNYHAKLHENVRWVHFSPGAYVKGAFEFQGQQHDYKVTGYGILSGEKYVYEADKDGSNGHLPYSHRSDDVADCHGTCVKMLQFYSTDLYQRLDLSGLTIVNPPYHSFAIYSGSGASNYLERFATHVNNYKQVGSWYWQTDGIELLEGGSMKHTFFHANDDVLKLYHSDLTITDTVVWKGENGPVIQFGWTPREIENVHVKDVDVIHNTMYWKDQKHNTCIINSANNIFAPHSNARADPRKTIKNIFVENITSEGMNLCAMRLHVLSNWKNIHIKNLKIDAWNELNPNSQYSTFTRIMNEYYMQVSIGNESHHGNGLKIENYMVGDQKISKWNDNWSSHQAGRLNFDGNLWESWNAW